MFLLGVPLLIIDRLIDSLVTFFTLSEDNRLFLDPTTIESPL